jgi:hypothetical protein
LKEGSVLLYPKFEFPNGKTSDKRLIILYRPKYEDEDYIFALTTRNKRSLYFNQLGCQKNCYHLGAGQDKCFEEETWIQFDEIQFLSPKTLDKWIKQKQAIFKGKCISEDILELIKKCIKNSAAPNIFKKYF